MYFRTCREVPEKVYRYYYSFINLGARWGWVVRLRSGRFTPGKQTRYLFYMRLGGLQDHFGRVQKNHPLPRFDTHIVRPVASRMRTDDFYRTSWTSAHAALEMMGRFIYMKPSSLTHCSSCGSSSPLCLYKL